MTIRRFAAQLAVMVTGVALVGCSGGTGPVEPDPSPAIQESEESPEMTDDERAMQEGGADAALPPEDRIGEDQN